MALRHQYGFKWLSRIWLYSRPSVITGAMDINSDPDCCMAMDTNMTLGSSPGSNYSMAPDDSTGHLDQHDASSGMAL